MANQKSTKRPKTKNNVQSREKASIDTQAEKPKSVKKKHFYNNLKFWITFILVCTISIATITVLNSNNHNKLVSEYEKAWKSYELASNNYINSYWRVLVGLGLSKDESSDYYIDDGAEIGLQEQCAEKIGIYNELYKSNYAFKILDIENKSDDGIKTAIKYTKENTEAINRALDSVEECKEVGETKKKEFDEVVAQKEAEEAAKKKQQEESQAAYERNRLTYNKFTNEIHEGMTIEAVKSIYGWFDNECELSAQSGSYAIYSCSSSSSYNIWAASFSFTNGILSSKAQSGLK